MQRRPLKSEPTVTDRLKEYKITEANRKDMRSHRYHPQQIEYYSQLVQKVKNAAELATMLDEMLDKEVYPDPFIFNHCVKKLGVFGYTNRAEEMYYIAIQKNLFNKFTVTSMLNVLKQEKEPNVELAIQLFDEAKDSQLVNEVTYNTLLTIIGKSKEPNVKLATQVFYEANDSQFVDAFTYSTLLSIIAKSKDPNVNLAIQIFKPAMLSWLT
jgi:hypothetical protein